MKRNWEKEQNQQFFLKKIEKKSDDEKKWKSPNSQIATKTNQFSFNTQNLVNFLPFKTCFSRTNLLILSRQINNSDSTQIMRGNLKSKNLNFIDNLNLFCRIGCKNIHKLWHTRTRVWILWNVRYKKMCNFRREESEFVVELFLKY